MDKAPTAKYIVFVTPDLANFPSLSDMLAQVSSDWQLQFLSSASAALDLISSSPCDVILVDSKLSADHGLELLDAVWKTHPHIIRFLCAKAPSDELMMKCIWNSHRLFTYAPEATVVRDAIQRALEVQIWLSNRKVQQLVSRMRTFPSLPTLYFKVLKELESPHVSLERLAELVGGDLAITTKIIQVVNSAFYGQQRQIADVKEAIQVLGFETLKSLVLGIQAIARLDKVKPLYFSADKIWRHGLAVATLARRVAQLENSDRVVAEEAFTAGLLHDIGKLVLASNLDDQYNGALHLAQKKQIPLVEVETEVFGATHADTAAYLVAVWGLPRRIVEAIASHHSPGNSADTTFTPLAAVHIANVLVHEQSPEKDDFTKPPLDMDYLRRLGVQERLDFWRGTEAKHVKAHAPHEERTVKPVVRPTRPPPPRPGSARPSFELLAYVGGTVLFLIALSWIIMRATRPDPVQGPEMFAQVLKRNRAAQAKQERLAQEAASQPKPDRQAASTASAAVPLNNAEPRKAENSAPAGSSLPQHRPALVLSAIHYRPPKSGALINGRTVYEGDKIEGATVLGIEPDMVRILEDKQERVLKLH